MKQSDFFLNDGTPWRLFEPESAKKGWIVLWLQGFTSTIEGHTEGILRMSEQSKTAFAMLNYAGHGNHPIALNDATRKQQFEEVLAVYDELKKRGYERVIANGGSFGGYMAALLSGRRDLAGLVLRAPAVYGDDEFEMPYAQTRSALSLERKDIYRSTISADIHSNDLDAVRSYTGDTFVIEHELDEVINQAVPKAYYAVAQHGNYIVIRGCKHSPKLMDNPEHFFQIIERWNATIILTLQS